ncbi:type I polyketide synthase [Streptomyces halobius]|uniref:SDR family NAD(P)-dependent oxidoreductase n=1 Tax=Streptomyces halobius TaxID=2879846 RepID=A0ABY4LYQ3_9ACTN|nr:type I polyketide synthase [Streptomyces halobius]UQA90608.1 SDR family NAD(P)-dependent oxidoreductase [Streptomyces halobius]
MATDNNDVIGALRRSVKEAERLRRQNRELVDRASEPIAIVGMGCRFPGSVSSPQELWELVASGRDAVSTFPADRGWDVEGLFHPDPDHPGTAYTRQGGFVEKAGDFDAEFFGISPREALAMDPQQRLLLETAWEAMEDAGIDPSRLRGSDTGVFTGLMYADYQHLAGMSDRRDEIEGYLYISSAASVAAGRISYTFGFEGPSVSVDTACSSSLVAIAQATAALRSQECSLALAGGVTVLSRPNIFVEFSRQRALSADGRCKAYGAGADGVGWSEGCGLLVLERLSDARRNGHRVLGLLRGSAVNQDGASNGLTAPNGPSQERVIRAALAGAGLSPSDVDAVEGHGTGTPLGDPIEAEALLATYGRQRAGGPLWLGSLKSNIGHTQAAAGVAGVIKMVMAMRHGVLPPTLHADEPSPHVNWSSGQVALLTEARQWPASDRPRRAGVSSFGISGTNAHVIIEEAPAQTPVAEPRPAGAVPVLLSARSGAALRAQAERLRAHLVARPELSVADVAFSTVTSRALLERRAQVTASDRDELLAGLASVAAGESAIAGGTAFLFSGQGAQRVRMGLDLAERFPLFGAVLDEVCAQADPHLGRSLREVLAQGGEVLDSTRFTQVALFAVEVALFRLVESLGIRPDYLIGHSVGEIAAAHVAGVLSLADAVELVVARGRLMGALPAGGAMVAVQAGEDEVAESLAGFEGRLDIAAVNGPRAVVVSGDREAVGEWLPRWDGRRTTWLRVSHAFHSPCMEPMLEEFRAVAEGLSFVRPRIPLVSNVTGQLVAEFDAEYWVGHVRRAVRFADGVRTLWGVGVRRFLELGPDAVLTAMARQSLEGESGGVFLPVLRGGHPEVETFARFVGQAHNAGAEVDWAAYYAGTGARRVELPTYAFQREHYWPAPGSGVGDITAAGLGRVDHPILAGAVRLGDRDEWLFTGRLSTDTQPWTQDHQLFGTTVVPGTALVELALAAGRQTASPVLDEMVLKTPLLLEEGASRQLQVTVGPADDDGRREVAVYSHPESSDVLLSSHPHSGDQELDAVCHARGVLNQDTTTALATWPAQWPPKGAEPLSAHDLYTRLSDLGYAYGPAFQGVQALWRDGDHGYAEVVLPQTADGAGHGIHPALFDAVLHSAVVPLSDPDDNRLRAPFSFGDVRLGRLGATRLRVRSTVTGDGAVQLDAVDESGTPVLSVGSLAVRPLDQGHFDTAKRSLYRLDWVPVTAAGAAVRVVDLADLDQALTEGVPDAVVASVGTSADGSAQTAAHSALQLVQRWLADERVTGSRLVVVTCGAVAAGTESPDVAQAPVWGLVRTAQSEHPGRFVLVDVDADGADGADWGAVIGSGEPQLAVRGGRLLAPRLHRAAAASPRSWSAHDSVLITGGTGGLGAVIARHLVEHGVRRLQLVSRRGIAAPGAQKLVAELVELGCDIRVEACDVTDRDQVAGLLAALERPLTAVVHAAGVLDDGVVESLTAEQLERVMRPKADAAWHLHELTAGMDLSAFVLFSSVSALIGTPGQANYAAANAVLDALAAKRRAEGLPATSLAWGLWADASGMEGELGEADLARLARMGIGALPPAQALELFDHALGQDTALLAPVTFDLAALRTQARAGLLPAPLHGLAPAPRRAETGVTLAQRLADVAEADRERVVRELVAGQVAAALGHTSAASIDPERAFTDLGFDSLTAVDLRNNLTQATGVALPATLVFDHPSPVAVARLLLREVDGTVERRRPAARPRRVDDEPIAIVGMGCRFPGSVSSPQELWELVASGRDAVSTFPADRGWDVEGLFHPDPDHPGTAYTRQGGFVEKAGDFDAEFFGISPREALAMDPQQRLLLETAWEAMEDAGIDPSRLRGSDTGVFTGLMYADYQHLAGMSDRRDEIEGYLMISSAASVASGRISYTFGFEGPSVSVDTACSSSLVAIAQATAALRSQECSLALAGGVTVLSRPNIFVEFSRQRGLAPDGRCKAYGAGADGVGWSEGCGLLVLERLSDARRNGHRVLGLLRGSAVNQDGASNGLTAPNGPSQERVIRAALAGAGLSPSDVDAVEGHGTGTPLGDPIEAEALLATYGRQRAGGPLWLGSLKSNIGHTQAAAGVAGVIKMVMAMRHGVLPPTLHADEPSPHVNWSSGQVALLTEARQWPASDRPRRAGVSSFGISGTNAHVIIEEAPAQTPAQPAETQTAPVPAPSVLPVVVSARSQAALRTQADRLRAQLIAQPELSTVDMAFSLATMRAQLEHRAVVVATDRGALLTGLGHLSSNEPSPAVVEGRPVGGKAVFVFPGQGAQWAGMATELADSSPVFARRLAQCATALDAFVDWRLDDVLRGAQDAPSLERVDVVQPALWAVMVSLAELWRSYGVEPSAVVGHSQGEIAAAVVAGGLSIEDGARVVALRSRLVRDHLAGKGAMVSVALPAQQAEDLIAPYEGRVSLAAVNGPAAVVLAGEPQALDDLIAVCERDEIRARRVNVDYASHSAQVETIEPELAQLLAPLAPKSGQVPLYSTATGAFIDTATMDAAYWYGNLRAQVGFQPAVQALIADGTGCFLEMSPHPVLAMAVEETAAAHGAADRVAVIGSLRRDEGGLGRFVTSLAEAHVAGVAVDWSPFHVGARRAALPTYPFQRERFWLTAGSRAADASAAGQTQMTHPVLAAAVPVADRDEWVFTGQISQETQPWTQDHMVFGTVLVPGTALVEMALTAGRELGCTVVDELVLQAPLLLAQDATRQLQVTVGSAGDDGRREVAIYSRPQSDGDERPETTCHGRGWLAVDAAPPEPFEAQWPPAGAEPAAAALLYERLADIGLDYGPLFQGVRAAWRAGDTVYAEVALPDDTATGGFGLHPALFDAALHGAMLSKEAGSPVDLPFSFSGVRLGRTGLTRARVRITSAPSALRVAIADDAGVMVASVDALGVRPLEPGQLDRAQGSKNTLFQVDWAQVTATPSASVRVVRLGTEHADLDALEQALSDGAQAPDLVVAAIDAPRGEPAAAARTAGADTLALVQQWLASERLGMARLAVVTRGGVAVGDESPHVAQAPVWGLVRSAQCEHPGRFLLVDLDGGREPDWGALLDLDEPQLAVRADRLLAPRLARTGETLPAHGAWRLAVGRAGSLEDLAIAPSEGNRSLGVGEVRVAVRAAGLNFRDVLIALGLYPGRAPLGSEAAGVVLEVGADVTDLAPGDRVFGLITDAFGPVAVADRRTVVPIPPGLTFVEAAAVPVVYLTAYYGLVDLAGLQPGEQLLVHAAAGGVGMAAIQLARHLGAQVFATASPHKWDAVRALGVPTERIASSRDLDFRQAFLDATGGAGMDVVLDSLAGEFVDASLELLPNGGRFIEMGKTDIRDPEVVARENQGVRYRSFDMTEAGPERIQEMLTEISALFGKGVLTPSPIRTWDVRRGPEAFRFLREGHNIGKIVFTVPAPLDPDGTVLITGGTSGLGAQFAKHLAERHGARNLLLASRRGRAADGVDQLVAELEQLGATARVEACDAADRDQLAGLLGSLDRPLTAVVHCAGVLDDGVVEALTTEQIDRVMRPKIDAAWNLHEQTTGHELSAFVLFSSAAGQLGNPGQANYAAANAALDALAHRRRATGLPANSLAWGLWADTTGMTGEMDEADLARMARTGIGALSAELGLELFDQSLGSDAALLVPLRLDLSVLRTQAREGTLPALLRGLVRAPARRAESVGGSLAQRLAHVAEAEREQVVLELVQAQVAAVRGNASAAEVEPDRAFKMLGFDSLAAVELRNRLARQTGLRLPATLVFDYPTPAEVAQLLLKEAGGADQQEGQPPFDEELRKLEELLIAVAGDERALAGIEPRLRYLSNRLRAVLGATGAEPSEGDAEPDDDLDVASDDEVFNLIDKELGSA